MAIIASIGDPFGLNAKLETIEGFIPEGGTAGQVLTRKSDGTTEWKTIQTLPAGENDKVLAFVGGALAWVSINQLPAGGTSGQVLSRTSDGYAWMTLSETGTGLPEGGTNGQILSKTAEGYAWINPTPSRSQVMQWLGFSVLSLSEFSAQTGEPVAGVSDLYFITDRNLAYLYDPDDTTSEASQTVIVRQSYRFKARSVAGLMRAFWTHLRDVANEGEEGPGEDPGEGDPGEGGPGECAVTWDFNTNDDTEGWSKNDELSSLSVADGVLIGNGKWDSGYGTNPKIYIGDLSIAASLYKHVRVVVKWGSAGVSDNATLEWGESSKTISFTSSTSNQTLHFDLSSEGSWSGTITGLALSLMTQGSSLSRFDIDSISICES